MSSSLSIGFVGAGRMATALAKGLARGVSSPENIVACDPAPAALNAFAKEIDCGTAESISDVCKRSSIVVLAVKPQVLANVLAECREFLKPTHLVVSIAAGVPLRTMTNALGAETRLVRVMPNTPCLINCGASAYAVSNAATDDDSAVVQRMLETVGLAFQVPESQLDAVTGLSGSGPAYGYQIVEALSDGGVRAGLPRNVATTLAAQTLLGAARMVLDTELHPGELKDAVTSPGGTTIAGLHALERGGLRAALMTAVLAATERSKELGRSD